MKTLYKFFLSVLLLVLLSSCASAETAPEQPSGELETQVAATIFAEQTAAVPPTPTVNAIMAAITADALTKSAPRTPTATAAFDTYQVSVPAAACWMDSGVSVKTGQRIAIFASGTSNTYGGNEGSNADPNGQQSICGAIECPVQGVGYGSLIGRVGDQKAFFVGTYLEFTATQDANLFFTVNDWECEDNNGTFDLKINVD